MLKKNNQATGIVLVLRNNTRKAADLGNPLGRMSGAMKKHGKTLNITDVEQSYALDASAYTYFRRAWLASPISMCPKNPEIGPPATP